MASRRSSQLSYSRVDGTRYRPARVGVESPRDWAVSSSDALPWSRLATRWPFSLIVTLKFGDHLRAAAALRAWHLDNGASPGQLAAAGFFRAPSAAMILVLDALDAEFGSLGRYLEGIGVDVTAAREDLAHALVASD